MSEIKSKSGTVGLFEGDGIAIGDGGGGGGVLGRPVMHIIAPTVNGELDFSASPSLLSLYSLSVGDAIIAEAMSDAPTEYAALTYAPGVTVRILVWSSFLEDYPPADTPNWRLYWAGQDPTDLHPLAGDVGGYQEREDYYIEFTLTEPIPADAMGCVITYDVAAGD